LLQDIAAETHFFFGERGRQRKRRPGGIAPIDVSAAFPALIKNWNRQPAAVPDFVVKVQHAARPARARAALILKGGSMSAGPAGLLQGAELRQYLSEDLERLAAEGAYGSAEMLS
jgi:hypothetical protein